MEAIADKPKKPHKSLIFFGLIAALFLAIWLNRKILQ